MQTEISIRCLCIFFCKSKCNRKESLVKDLVKRYQFEFCSTLNYSFDLLLSESVAPQKGEKINVWFIFITTQFLYVLIQSVQPWPLNPAPSPSCTKGRITLTVQLQTIMNRGVRRERTRGKIWLEPVLPALKIRRVSDFENVCSSIVLLLRLFRKSTFICSVSIKK